MYIYRTDRNPANHYKIMKSSVFRFEKVSLHVCVFFLLSVFATGCGEHQANEERQLTGRYINQTFIDQVADSIPGLIPIYCYEMNFADADSVTILYGFEQAKLAYKKSGNKYLLQKALKDKDMVFTVHADHTITLIDSAWNNTHTNSRFTAGKNDTDFTSALNRKMIAGTYDHVMAGKASPQKVVFKEDGTVTGLAKFTTYSLCYSGDCVGDIYPISNSITLSNDKKETVSFAFKKDNKQKRLGIYYIEAPVQDIKGERAIKGIAFDLRQ